MEIQKMTNPGRFKDDKERTVTGKDKSTTWLKRFKNLLGAGPHLLLLGLVLEGVTVVIRNGFLLTSL
jgi:hypothetical protein